MEHEPADGSATGIDQQWVELANDGLTGSDRAAEGDVTTDGDVLQLDASDGEDDQDMSIICADNEDL